MQVQTEEKGEITLDSGHDNVKNTTQMKTKKFAQSCCNISYDILTILISIADVKYIWIK